MQPTVPNVRPSRPCTSLYALSRRHLSCRRARQAAAGNPVVQHVLAQAAAAGVGLNPGPMLSAEAGGAGAAAAEAGGIVEGPGPAPGAAAGARAELEAGGAARDPHPDPSPAQLVAGAAAEAGERAGGLPELQNALGPMQAASPSAQRVRTPCGRPVSTLLAGLHAGMFSVQCMAQQRGLKQARQQLRQPPSALPVMPFPS